MAPPQPAPTPPRPPRSPGRRLAWLGAGAAVAVAGAVALILALSGNGGENPPSETPAAGRVIAQYRYQFTLPDGWTQTGGNPEKLATELKPSGAEQGVDLILVQQNNLAFDSDANRGRAVDSLREEFEARQPAFSDFDENATFAGRPVIHYLEHLDAATVDWYVIFKSHTQVSVGCKHAAPADAAVQSACDTVVRTLTIPE